MARNGSGTYTLPEAPFVPSTPILSSAVNSDLSDIATALTGSVAADGQTTITGTLKGYAGSQALPSYTFSNDQNTGMWRSGADMIAFSTNAVKRVEISNSGIDVTGTYSENGIPIKGVPLGAWIAYGGSTAPALFIFAYGQNISRTTYADLFAEYGTTYGSGDGSTTFGVPDLRGRGVIGRDNMGGSAANRVTSTSVSPDGNTLGAVGGAQTHTLTTGEVPSLPVTGTVSVSSNVTNILQGGAGSINYQPGGRSAQVLNGSTAAGGVSSTGTILSATATGGGGAHVDLDPGIIGNYIIFAGA